MVLRDEAAPTAFDAVLGFPDRADVRQSGLSSILQGGMLCLATLLYVPSEHLFAEHYIALELNALPFDVAKQASSVADARHWAGCGTRGGL